VLAIYEHISNHNPIDTFSSLEWLQNCTLSRLSHSPQTISVSRKKGYENQALQHITTNPDISYEFEFDFDFTTSFRLFWAMLAQHPRTSWRMSAFIACISTQDSVGRVYPIFASLVTYAMTSYFCVIVCWGAFISISEICTTTLPLLAVMEKPIQHWINRPLSTWKVWTFTAWTSKFESVALSQMIG
jgi:hypothetical protein